MIIQWTAMCLGSDIYFNINLEVLKTTPLRLDTQWFLITHLPLPGQVIRGNVTDHWGNRSSQLIIPATLCCIVVFNSSTLAVPPFLRQLKSTPFRWLSKRQIAILFIFFLLPGKLNLHGHPHFLFCGFLTEQGLNLMTARWHCRSRLDTFHAAWPVEGAVGKGGSIQQGNSLWTHPPVLPWALSNLFWTQWPGWSWWDIRGSYQFSTPNPTGSPSPLLSPPLSPRTFLLFLELPHAIAFVCILILDFSSPRHPYPLLSHVLKVFVPAGLPWLSHLKSQALPPTPPEFPLSCPCIAFLCSACHNLSYYVHFIFIFSCLLLPTSI